MNTLLLKYIAVKELKFQILPTRWCFLCISAESVRVKLKAIPNEGNIVLENKRTADVNGVFSSFIYGVITIFVRRIATFLYKIIDLHFRDITIEIGDTDKISLHINCISFHRASSNADGQKMIAVGEVLLTYYSDALRISEKVVSFRNSILIHASSESSDYDVKTIIHIHAANRSCIECFLSRRLYLILPLLQAVFFPEPLSFDSPVLFCPDDKLRKVSYYTSALLLSWLKSMRSFYLDLVIDLPGFVLPQCNTSLEQLSVQCGLEIDMMDGVSLSEDVKCSGNLSVFGSLTTFEITSSTSLDIAVTTSPIVLNITPDILSSISEVIQFFSLLPARHLPITQPRLLFFGSGSRRDKLLSFELQDYQQSSFPIQSIRLCIPRCDILLVDQRLAPLVELYIDTIEADPKNGLSLKSIRLLAGCSEVVSIPRICIKVCRHAPFQPSISDFSSIFEEKVTHREALFINAPTNTSCFATFFQKNSRHALFTLSTSLPEITLFLEQKSVLAIVQVIEGLPAFSLLPSLPFFQPAFYEIPLFDVDLTCDSLTVQLQSNVFKLDDSSRFLSLALNSLSFHGFFGSQNTDLTVDFDTLLVLIRFIHLATPLTEETLTGYDGDVELESWESAKLRYQSLPDTEIELLTVESSQIHLFTTLNILPSSHCWLLSHGELCRDSINMREIGLGSRLRSDCNLGRIDLIWDDVAVADLLWGVLTIIDLIASVPSQETPSCVSVGSEVVSSNMVFQLSSPLLSLTCMYNQKEFQMLQAPVILFEFGMLESVEKNEISPSQFFCGVSTHGIYWTDLTNDLSTNQILHSQRNCQEPFSFRFQLTWHLDNVQRLYAPFVELDVANCELTILIRQLMEIANWFFTSFYPALMWVTYFDLPYRRARRLEKSPLAQLLHISPDSTQQFHQPKRPSGSEYVALVATWPYVEAIIRNVVIHIPQASNRSEGVILELMEAIFYTHKPQEPHMPLGSFIHTGQSVAALRRGNACVVDLSRSDIFRFCDEDDIFIFPRFIIDVRNARLLRYRGEEAIANNIKPLIRFRPKVFLSLEALQEIQTMHSEQKLLWYHKQMGHENIPNSFGLPMEVSVIFEELPLNLHQDDYGNLLYFFFLNLAELPTICCDAYIPRCSSCGYTHEPGYLCTDCWCVLHVRCEKVLVQPMQGKGTSIKQLGRIRLDTLDFYSYLLNTSTKVLVVIPTVLFSDLTHVTIFPDNATSYHLRCPVNRESSLLEPMVVLRDVEDLNRFLINVQLYYFLSLYSWVCDPVWATYDFPEAEDWPAKIGEYHIHVNNYMLAILNSTPVTEPTDHVTCPCGSAATLSSGAMIYSLLTNRNRIGIGIGGNCSVDCIMDGNVGTMDIAVGLSVNQLGCCKLRNVFSIPNDESSLSLEISYKYNPSKSVSTIISIQLMKSELILYKDSIRDLIQILSYQVENASQCLLSSSVVSSSSKDSLDLEVPTPLKNQHTPVLHLHRSSSISSDDSSEEMTNGMRVNITLKDPWNISLVRKSAVIKATFLSLAGNISMDSNQTNGSISLTLRGDYKNDTLNCFEPWLEPMSLVLSADVEQSATSINLMFPRPININLTYRFLYLIRRHILGSTELMNRQSNFRSVLIKNELSQDVNLMISELVTVSHSRRHLNRTMPLTLTKSTSYEYGIQSKASDSFAVVAVAALDSYRVVHVDSLHRSIRSIGDQPSNSGDDLQELVFSSQAAVLIDREKTLLLSLSSNTSHHFVVVNVTISPFTITFTSPVSIENTTSHSLICLLKHDERLPNETKMEDELIVKPFSSVPIPFHFCVCPFTLQMKPDAYSYSAPLLSTDIPSDKPKAITCPPLPQYSTFSAATSWNAHIRCVYTETEELIKMAGKQWKGSIQDIRSKLLKLRIEPILSISNDLPFPLNYMLHDTSQSIVACGVIPELHTAQLHSCTNEMGMYSFLVSLWGYDYSQPIEISPMQQGNQRVHLHRRQQSIDSATVEISYSESSISVRAPYQIINKTPFSLYYIQNGVSSGLAPYHPLDAAFIPFAPFQSSVSSVPLSPVRYRDKETSISFKTALNELEESMNVLTPSTGSYYSEEMFPQDFICWIGLPINQKESLSFNVTPDMTFETLFQLAVHEIYPNETIASSDYYFLNIKPERVVRVQIGEYVSAFADSPRFLLRHNEHGLQGAVINDTISLERLDQSFIRIQTDYCVKEHTIGLFSESQLSSISISAKDSGTDGGVSIGDLIEDDDLTEKKINLSADIMVDNSVKSIILPLSLKVQQINDTNVIVVSPQHVINNQSDMDLILKTPTLYKIPARTLSVLCLQEGNTIQSLRLKRDAPDWEYSGDFSFYGSDKMYVKSVHSQTHQLLIFEVAPLSTDYYSALTITYAPHVSPTLVHNYCPFPVVIGQCGSSVMHKLPAFSQLKWIREEPQGSSAMHVDVTGARGVVSTNIHMGETEKVHIPTVVPIKEEFQLEADVYVRSRGKWRARRARLGDHILLLYTIPNLSKRVRRVHGSLPIALPLRDVRVTYIPSRSQYSSTLRNHVLSQAAALKNASPSTFTLSSLQDLIRSSFPQTESAQLIQDLILIGMLYKLPQGDMTPMSLQQEPLYAFRSQPLGQDCCITLEVASTKLELYFASASIAEGWAKKIRFEAETASVFPEHNYLGVRTRKTEFRDVDVIIQSAQKGIVPVVSIIPSDMPAAETKGVFSIFQSTHLTAEVYIDGIGLSLIDDTPEEMCYVWFDECNISVSAEDEIQAAVVNLKNIQIDVSSYSATFPSLLYTLPQAIDHYPSSLTVKSSSVESPPVSPDSHIQPDFAPRTRVSRHSRNLILHNLSMQDKETAELVQTAEKQEKESNFMCSSCGYTFQGDKRPFMHICCKRHINQQNCYYVDRGLVSFEKLVLKVDEQFLRRLNVKFGHVLVSLLYDCYSKKVSNTSDSPVQESPNMELVRLKEENIYDIKRLQELLNASRKPTFFIGDFSLHPVNVIFTLKSSLGSEENEIALGNQIADHWVSCDNTVIQLKEMRMGNVNGGLYEVFLTMRGYLVRELLKQIRTILSSVDVLGNLQYFKSEKESNIQNLNYLENSINDILSVSLVSKQSSSLPLYLASDLYDPASSRIFMLPAMMPEKKSLSSTVGKAIGNTLDGVAHVSSKITNGVASGLTSLIADDQFNLQRSIRINRSNENSFFKSLKSGSQAIGASVWSGIKGVVTMPIHDYQTKGAKGLITGPVKGVVGLALKPVVGLLDMLSQSTNGVKNSTQRVFKLRENVDPKMMMFSRVRPPRPIDENGRITDYNEMDAIGRLLLWVSGSTRKDEPTLLISNATTSGGTSIMVMMTEKRLLLFNVADIMNMHLIFEANLTSVDRLDAADDVLSIHLSKPISIAYYTPSVYRRMDEEMDFPSFSPQFAARFLDIIRQILPISCFSQFPYPYDPPSFISLCRMRCGKLNGWKKRYIAISRNCLYYFGSSDGSDNNILPIEQLPTGVVPLTKLNTLAHITSGNHHIVEVYHLDESPVSYLRLLSSSKITKRTKPRFIFSFDLEEEATFFMERIQSHLVESHPYEPIYTYEIQYDIRSLLECKLVGVEIMKLLNTVREDDKKPEQ